MKQKEYDVYKDAVQEFFEREGIQNLTCSGSEEDPVCPCCGENVGFEPYFSWGHCDCCGSHLGGNRNHASGYNPETEEAYCYEVCDDCVYYAEYGRLDDMTMMELSEATNA